MSRITSDWLRRNLRKPQHLQTRSKPIWKMSAGKLRECVSIQFVLRVLIIYHFQISEKEEEAARNVRRDQNVLSVEDIKKDFVKVQDQTNYLEEKIVTLQKLSESTGIESRNKCKEFDQLTDILMETLPSTFQAQRSAMM